MKKLALSVLLINLLAACASDKPKEVPGASAAPAATAAPKSAAPAAAPAATQPAKPASPVVATPARSETAAPVAAAAASPAADEEEEVVLEGTSAYFPFDVDVVQAGDYNMIQQHADYLRSNSAARVRIEGNCDERGSSEYNLGLGQRRANNVRRALIMAGAPADRIETVSFGEEKPVASGHDEESWAQNRRADIVYVAE